MDNLFWSNININSEQQYIYKWTNKLIIDMKSCLFVHDT